MKKALSLLLVLCVVLCFSACGSDSTAPGKTEGAAVFVGRSDLYTKEERAAAAEAVKEKFTNLNGCTLYSLTYAGDERSEQELLSHNRENDGAQYNKMIVFDSVFRSPKKGGGAWEANELYTWNWMVAQTEGGAWTVVNYGYA